MKCVKDCNYDPHTTPGCVSMHHCPECGEMQMAGGAHLCCCSICLPEQHEHEA